MGKNRSTENPNAAPMQKSAAESYTIAIQRLINSLKRYDDDGRAEDAIAILVTAKATLETDFYPSVQLQAEYDEAQAEEAIPPVEEVVAIATSPGVFPQGHEKEGDPLPPFSPMELPNE